MTTAQASLPFSREVLRVSLRLARGITEVPDEQRMLAELLRAVREVIPSDYIGATVLGENGTFTLPSVDPTVEIPSLQLSDYFAGAHLVAGGRDVLRFGADEVSDGFPVQWSLWQKLGVQSACNVPMVLHDRVLGGLSLWSRNPDAYADIDPTAAQQLGQVIGVLLESHRAHAELRLHRDEAADDNASLLAEMRGEGRTSALVGDTAVFRAVLEQISLVGPTSSTVLITGESGTGKELVARAIHEASPRRDRPFVTINCAALP